MTVRRVCFCLLALLLSACAARPPEGGEGGLRLYFTAESAVGGPAFLSQPYRAQEETPDPGHLLEALLAGPTAEGLSSPFPPGLTLRGWQWGEEPGVLLVNFSEHYGGLTEISLTLADYCVVLTLCQLEGVEGVEITSGGRAISYRGHQILRPEDVTFPLFSAEAQEGSAGAGAD